MRGLLRLGGSLETQTTSAGKLSSFFSKKITHTHTHTHIYIYIYVCVCVCVEQRFTILSYPLELPLSLSLTRSNACTSPKVESSSRTLSSLKK